jgi:hypothetical protein
MTLLGLAILIVIAYALFILIDLLQGGGQKFTLWRALKITVVLIFLFVLYASGQIPFLQ